MSLGVGPKTQGTPLRTCGPAAPHARSRTQPVRAPILGARTGFAGRWRVTEPTSPYLKGLVSRLCLEGPDGRVPELHNWGDYAPGRVLVGCCLTDEQCRAFRGLKESGLKDSEIWSRFHPEPEVTERDPATATGPVTLSVERLPKDQVLKLIGVLLNLGLATLKRAGLPGLRVVLKGLIGADSLNVRVLAAAGDSRREEAKPRIRKTSGPFGLRRREPGSFGRGRPARWSRRGHARCRSQALSPEAPRERHSSAERARVAKAGE